VPTGIVSPDGVFLGSGSVASVEFGWPVFADVVFPDVKPLFQALADGSAVVLDFIEAGGERTARTAPRTRAHVPPLRQRPDLWRPRRGPSRASGAASSEGLGLSNNSVLIKVSFPSVNVAVSDKH